MRTIEIEMSKAARERLFLMREPAALPLPFDAARIAPLTIRFERDVLFIALNGQDLAFTSPRLEFWHPRFLHATVFSGENPTLDAALRHVFEVLRTHLNAVHRLNAQAQRERQEREDREMEEMLREEVRIPDEMIAYLGEGGVGPFPDLRFADLDVLEGLTPLHADFEFLHGGEHQAGLRFGRGAGIQIVPTEDGGVRFGDEDSGLDIARVAAELRQRVDQARRLQDITPVLAAISRLPVSDLDPIRFVMCGDPGGLEETVVRDIGDGVFLHFRDREIEIVREDCVVAWMQIRSRERQTMGWAPKTVREMLLLRRPFLRSEFSGPLFRAMADPDFQRLAGAWLSAFSESRPDHDFARFRAPDEVWITRSVEGIGGGYAF